MWSSGRGSSDLAGPARRSSSPTRQKIDNIQLQMPRGGVISGVVVDEVGDPIFGVPVRVWRYVNRNGTRELTATSNSDTTDDRGQYRVSGLVPGEYVVCAAPRDELMAGGRAVRHR